MIVPMHRLTVLCMTADRDRTLASLADLGVVHLSDTVALSGPALEKAEHEVAHIRRALRELNPEANVTPSGLSAPDSVEAIWGYIRRRRVLREELRQLREERERIAPFGSFDPAELAAQAEQGVFVRLYTAHPKDSIEVPDTATRIDLGRDNQAVYFAIVSTDPDIVIDAARVEPPSKSLAAIEEAIARLSAENEDQKVRVQQYAGDYKIVRDLLHRAESRVNLLHAKSAMVKSGPVTYLRGFVPVDVEPRIHRAAQENGWGILAEEPKPSDPTPTLIRNPTWVRPIQLVFDFISIVPGYREVDISALFLLFFSLFFAMIVGDAGYGAIFLGLTLAGRMLLPKAPRALWFLMGVMSLCTIVWGLLTGVVFGMAKIPAVLETVKVPWLTDANNVMLLCFLIGAVHLTLAHGWNAIRFINTPRALAQVGWICTTWVMFFTARTMVLGKAFPPVMMWVLGVGVLLILVFMTPLSRLKAEWFNHVMFPLNLISNFVDVVSYVRLFAVGMATYAMASAFNQMAGGMGGVGGALLLFLGHTLNIALATMGVLVHGIRLNTLEFSGHLGQEWIGIKYTPFSRRAGGNGL